MSYELIQKQVVSGLEFQKPNVKSKILDVTPTGFTYSIGKQGNKKNIHFATFSAAFQELQNNGELSRTWFNNNFPKEAKAAPCNFTTIGGLFQYFGMAEYVKGSYKKICRVLKK